jgi:hypothetical protein
MNKNRTGLAALQDFAVTLSLRVRINPRWLAKG